MKLCVLHAVCLAGVLATGKVQAHLIGSVPLEGNAGVVTLVAEMLGETVSARSTTSELNFLHITRVANRNQPSDPKIDYQIGNCQESAAAYSDMKRNNLFISVVDF